MPAHRSSSSTSTASRAPPSPLRGPRLEFISPEPVVAIPAYPSFKDRLSATDTWTKPSPAPAGRPTPALLPVPRAGSSSSASRTASTSLTPSLSPAPRAHSSRSTISPRTHPYQRARSNSTSSSATASSGASTSTAPQLQAAQAAAVRAALQHGRLDANSYTDGQLYAIREGAARAFARRGGGGGGGGRGEVEGQAQARGEGGKKRKRRGAGIEGREGGVVKAVKVRRSESCAVDGEGSEDEGEVPVKVEVDLRRMLGM
ncbi:hypothetical protein JCM3775_000228 [Rhodotorula graminis]